MIKFTETWNIYPNPWGKKKNHKQNTTKTNSDNST